MDRANKSLEQEDIASAHRGVGTRGRRAEEQAVKK
jgi:hypothetical protein